MFVVGQFFSFVVFPGIGLFYLLQRRMRQKDPASVILDVAAALTSKLRNGDYDKMLAKVAQPWQSLQVSDKAQLQDVDSLDSDDGPQCNESVWI